MKKVYAAVLLLAVLIVGYVAAQAQGVMPYADEVFNKNTVSLSADKKATFKAETMENVEITVTSCTLQKKSGSEWVYFKSLTPPDGAYQKYYSDKSDYSGSIPDGGPYRLKALFYADGRTVTAYSGERTF